MYEPADLVPLSANTDVYAEVNKQSKQRNLVASSDIYASVQKKADSTSSKSKIHAKVCAIGARQKRILQIY